MNNQANRHVLLLSKDNDTTSAVYNKLTDFGFELSRCHNSEDLTNLRSDSTYKVGLVDLQVGDLTERVELIKSIKATYKNIQLIGLYSNELNISNSDLQEMNLNQIFNTSFEFEFFINTLFDISPIDIKNNKLTPDLLSRINIFEISHSESLPFDLFVCLPANKKIIQIRKEGEEMEETTIIKFKKHKDYSLFIRKSDGHKYTEYTHNFLQNIHGDTSLEEAQKQNILKNELKNMMNGFFSTTEFNPSEADQLFSQVGKVLLQLNGTEPTSTEVMNSVEELTAQNITSYTHSKNVATYCVLFGMTVGIKDIDALRIGGFLHDIGMGDFDPTLSFKNINDMTPEELAQFKLHPGNAKHSIGLKKMELPDISLEMIMNHHEHMDGTGFPYGKTKDEISDAAKICAFADEFDLLTSLRFGYQRLSPAEAMLNIAGLDGTPPSPIYDPDFHEPLIALYVEDKKSKNSNHESYNLGSVKVSESEGSHNGSEISTKTENEKTSEVIVELSQTETSHGKVLTQDKDDISTNEVRDDNNSKASRIKPDTSTPVRPGYVNVSTLLLSQSYQASEHDRSEVCGATQELTDDFEGWESDLKNYFNKPSSEELAA